MQEKKQLNFGLQDFIKFLKTPIYDISELKINGKRFVFNFTKGLADITVDGVRVWSSPRNPVTTNPRGLLTEWLNASEFILKHF